MATEKRKKHSLSAFTILLIILAVVCLITVIFNGKPISDGIFQNLDPDKYGDLMKVVQDGGHVTVEKAHLKDFMMAIPNGFVDASDLLAFICALGGFIGIVMKTGALEGGVNRLVHKMKGKESWLIGILMFLFSLGGSTYGMAEETIGFYALITAAMVAAGFDTLVALAVILLGSTAGCLGSTINPFATGVAMSGLSSIGITPNKTLIMGIGAILWLATVAINIAFTLRYALSVKKDLGHSVLSQGELNDMKTHFGEESDEVLEYNGKHKAIMGIFAFTFLIMIISLISWEDIIFHGDSDAYAAAFGWTEGLVGLPLGQWYFLELASWFILSAIIIGLIGGLGEHGIVETFIDGVKDLMSVGMIIAVSRGITVVMKATHLDFFVLDKASQLLSGVPGFVYIPMAYIIYILLSFLIPSTSGLAGLSIPITGGLSQTLGFNPSVMVNVFSAGSGIVNMVTPTSGVVMGGVAAARVEYATYLKWVKKLLIFVFLENVIVLMVAEAIF